MGHVISEAKRPQGHHGRAGESRPGKAESRRGSLCTSTPTLTFLAEIPHPRTALLTTPPPAQSPSPEGLPRSSAAPSLARHSSTAPITLGGKPPCPQGHGLHPGSDISWGPALVPASWGTRKTPAPRTQRAFHHGRKCWLHALFWKSPSPSAGVA